MIKHTQTIRRQIAIFVTLARKGLKFFLLIVDFWEIDKSQKKKKKKKEKKVFFRDFEMP